MADPVSRRLMGLRRRSVIPSMFVLLLSLLLAVSAPPAWAGPPLPHSMASLGDSISRAFNACGWYVDCPSQSWSTGAQSGLRSHRTRLRTRETGLVAYNEARTGAKVGDLKGQADKAVSRGVGYITILIGANDVCKSSELAMTTAADYETRFRRAMSTLRAGLPGALIYVSSVPDVKRLWKIGKGNYAARSAWDAFKICPSMLADPTSKAPDDNARRDRVRQRVIAYNAVLARVCGETTNCLYDGGAVFGNSFTLSQVSPWDYFHPNASGQAALAEETWERGFWGVLAGRRAA